MRLQARSLPGEYFDRLTVSRLLNFEKTHLHQTYLAGWAFREDGDERPFGLVVGMPNVRGGVIIHDADLPGLTGRSTLVHKSLDPGEPPAITVEPYTAFLRRLVKHWRCGGPLPVVGPRDEVRPRLERVIGDRPLRYIGRDEGASPATGNYKIHQAEERALVDQALKRPRAVQREARDGAERAAG